MAKALGVTVSKPSKYRAQPQWRDGIKFDSKREERRYCELLNLVKAGQIVDVEVHPTYQIAVNGIRICRYSPDFRYAVVATKATVVEDVKSEPTRTKESYRIKKKLVEAIFGISIVEV